MSRYIKFDDAVKIMACEMYAEAQSQGYDVDGIEDFMPEAKAWITDAPSIDICFCKECKHRPIKEDADGADYGFNLIAPNEQELCPCLVEDGWYSWMPEDDFYCGYGCREEE